MNETMNVLLSRRSIRAYKPEQIRDEELFEVIEAGKYAANGMGKQSTYFVVVQNEADRMEISSTLARIRNSDSDPFYGAPTYVLGSVTRMSERASRTEAAPLETCSTLRTPSGSAAAG